MDERREEEGGGYNNKHEQYVTKFNSRPTT